MTTIHELIEYNMHLVDSAPLVRACYPLEQITRLPELPQDVI